MSLRRVFQEVAFLGVALLFLLSLFTGLETRGDDLLKANLDLPFDAGGEEEEEEPAPEIVVFYGQIYEASTVVFALDESGSMNEAQRWQLQSREVTKAIFDMSSDADFGVVYYGSRVTAFQNSPVQATPMNKSGGVNFVRSRSPQGDTCLGEGVVKALEIASRSSKKHRSVIVTSDGIPDNCATGNRATPAEKERIMEKTLIANPGRSIRVHTIWVGTANEQEAIEFMRRLAEAHGGSFRIVSR